MTKRFRIGILWAGGSTTWKYYSTLENALAWKPDSTFLDFPRVEEIQEKRVGKWVNVSNDGKSNE